MKRIILLFLLFGNLVTQAQIKVGSNPSTINSSAMLEVESTTKGFLPPRMTTSDRNALSNPAPGLMIFNTTIAALEVNTGTASTPVWSSVSGTNLYNADGTLTGNRTITTNGYGLIVKSNNAVSNSSIIMGRTADEMDMGVAGAVGAGLASTVQGDAWLKGLNNLVLGSTGTTSGVKFETNGAERMRIGAFGNVGIGTTSPISKLHVDGGGNGSVRAVNLATNAGLLFSGYTNAAYIQYEGTAGSNTSLNLSARGGGNSDVTINGATGNVTIGPAGNWSKLNVGDDSSSSSLFYRTLITFAAANGPVGNVYRRNNGTTEYLGMESFNAAGTVKTPIVFNEYGGNVGIGTSTPSAILHLSGNAVTDWRASSIFSTNTGTGGHTWAFGARPLGTAGDFYIGDETDGAVRMTVQGGTGNVGIGTLDPKAPLHIGGTTASSFSTGPFAYFDHTFSNGSGVVKQSSSGPRTDASIIAEGNIWSKTSIVSAQTITFSDRRIKNIIGLSDADKDLDLLNKIRVTDYSMKDVVKFGNQQYKKVIAQEVETVYPQAVTTQTGFVPNIYQPSDKVQSMGNNTYKVSFKNKVEYNKNVTGDLKLYDEKKEMTAKVVSKKDNEIVFTTTDAIQGNKLFLFGEEVTDFRAVDYEALSTLNISATQELYRNMQAQQQEIEGLKKKNATLIASIEEMKKLESAYVQLAAQVKEMQQVLSLSGKQSSTLAVVKSKE